MQAKFFRRNYKEAVPYAMLERYSAGILPYTMCDDGQLYFLLGKDIRENTWSDFGGKCEDVDCSQATCTAIREFYEETCGVVMDLKSLKHRMNSKANYTEVVSRTQNGHPYYMFLLEIPYSRQYRSNFRKLLYFLKYRKLYKKVAEKTDIQWVSLRSLQQHRLQLRTVFETTFTSNLSVIERLATSKP